MATPRWQSGRLYPPGSIVVPRTRATGGATSLTNAGFEDGATGWGTIGGGAPPAGWSFENTAGQAYQGAGYVRWSGITDGEYLWNEAVLSVGPGTRVNVSAVFAAEGARDQAGGHVAIAWFDANGQQIGFQIGNQAGLGGYQSSSFSLLAPARAVTARIAVGCYTLQGGNVRVDAVSLQYTPYVQAGLQYRAVQSRAGYSSNAEPAWPGQLGQQVIDNEVIWEAVSVARVVYEARPIMRSGATEPNWPAAPGGRVLDGTISWEAVPRRVTDPKCPNSKEVVIAASKVFAADEDIVAFSATVNPMDWSSADNAGYLPTGLQLYGANPAKALGLYRSNVVAFNAQGAQVWQVDEDPALMALLDAFPIGSEHHHAISPVTNDLFILTQLGVRTVGIAGGSTNLQAGDVGMPIDPMVKEALDRAIAAGVDPLGLYNPNAGQYWLLFKGQPASGQTLGFVYTMNQLGKIGAWTRYLFPFEVTDWCILGESLYLRHGDIVSRVTSDYESDEDESGDRNPFDWTIQWPWLDFGAMGVTKMMLGFDIIGTGTCRIQFGYDQTDGGRWTPEWELISDSVPGQLLPMPLAAPSLAVRLIYQGNDVTRTGWDALNLHFNPFRPTA